jgi:predicted transcriptional regulator
MKVAVSIPDDLFGRADQLARRLGATRSQVYRDALTEYLLRREPSEITAALDKLAGEMAGEPDPWLASAATSVLHRSEW